MFMFCLSLVWAGCLYDDGTEELPVHTVEIRLGGLLPENGEVENYVIDLQEAFIIVSHPSFYGSKIETQPHIILYHGGHQHGEAVFSGELQGTYCVDLLADPMLLGTLELTEGHYFDGRLYLIEAEESSLPVDGEGQAVKTNSPIWGHTLYLEGTAIDDEGEIPFTITIDGEAAVAGIEYGVYVDGVTDTEIVTLFDLSGVLSKVDFRQQANESSEGRVTILPGSERETYSTLREAVTCNDSFVDDSLVR